MRRWSSLGRFRQLYERGDADKMLPFLLMGWVECTVGTAYDWTWSGLLNNVHTQSERLRVGERSSGIGVFHQVSRITHTGALLIGTYDNFTDGNWATPSPRSACRATPAIVHQAISVISDIYQE